LIRQTVNGYWRRLGSQDQAARMLRGAIMEETGSRVVQCDAKLRYLGSYVRAYMRDYGLRHFVETGTGIGESAAFIQGMVDPSFDTIWSCDVEQLQIERALGVYPQLGTDPRVGLICAKSTDMLRMLREFPEKEPTLFWLDSHFPGTYYGRKKFSDEKDPDVRMPLEHEIALIRKHRPLNRDVILIDDLWFWLPGEFEWGTLPDELKEYCPQDGIEFIERTFGETHTIEVHREFAGWLSLTPAT
jgi:hypothetical protein